MEKEGVCVFREDRGMTDAEPLPQLPQVSSHDHDVLQCVAAESSPTVAREADRSVTAFRPEK